MARPKTAPPAEEEKVLPLQGWKAAACVLAVLVVAVALAVEGLSTGSLYVKVDTVGVVPPNYAATVCVYEGDVADQLLSGDVSNYPQAVAAVTVEPGAEVQVNGRWKGDYTLAIVKESGAITSLASVMTTTVGKGETHVGFMLNLE